MIEESEGKITVMNVPVYEESQFAGVVDFVFGSSRLEGFVHGHPEIGFQRDSE